MAGRALLLIWMPPRVRFRTTAVLTSAVLAASHELFLLSFSPEKFEPVPDVLVVLLLQP